MTKVNEKNFIKFIKKKKSIGLNYVVDTYGDLIYKVIYSTLGSGFHVHYIEECLNDVFLAIWNNVEAFDENKGDFKSWIIAISKYKSIDYKRRLLKENHMEYVDVIQDDLQGDTEKLVIMKENMEEMLSLISKLKEKDKIIFMRRYFFDESIESIAKELNVNRSVIDNRLSRGRKTLREKFNSLKGVNYNG